MHRHRKQLTGRLESCWQDHAPWADSSTHPITRHVISKMQPQPYYRSQTRGEILGSSPGFTQKWLLNTVWIERRVCTCFKKRPDEHPWLQRLWLIHCVMWTAGNGITFVEGREDNTVTLDNGLAMNRNRPCQAVSASAFQLHTTTDTLYQSLFAFSPHFLPPSAKTALFLIRPSCVWRTWLHWFWQVPINTSLLYVAPSLTCFFFFFEGKHLAPCAAVWRLTQPVISSSYSWLIFDGFIYIIDRFVNDWFNRAICLHSSATVPPREVFCCSFKIMNCFQLGHTNDGLIILVSQRLCFFFLRDQDPCNYPNFLSLQQTGKRMCIETVGFRALSSR